jgi:hypothetical protein
VTFNFKLKIDLIVTPSSASKSIVAVATGDHLNHDAPAGRRAISGQFQLEVDFQQVSRSLRLA